MTDNSLSFLIDLRDKTAIMIISKATKIGMYGLALPDTSWPGGKENVMINPIKSELRAIFANKKKAARCIFLFRAKKIINPKENLPCLSPQNQ